MLGLETWPSGRAVLLNAEPSVQLSRLIFISLCVTHVQVPEESSEGTALSGAGVTGDCEPPLT